jgi:hypothetical protein
MSIHLEAHPENKSLIKTDIAVDYQIAQDRIKLKFLISNYNTLNISDEFSDRACENWGLWNFDVIEFFVRASGANEYLELQTSLNNKQFILKIIRAREIYYTPMDLTFNSNSLADNGSITVEVDLPNIWNTTKLEGNFFAILGPCDSRCHYAWKLDPNTSADFHRPDLFEKL